jgi:predicted nucleic acid-binding Zn ribbon protein
MALTSEQRVAVSKGRVLEAGSRAPERRRACPFSGSFRQRTGWLPIELSASIREALTVRAMIGAVTACWYSEDSER